MTNFGLTTIGRGTFSCRIDGRAGYLRVWDDRLELIRSGRRGPEVLGPEEIPLYAVTAVVTGKPGRLFTAVEVVAGEQYLELKFPSLDAPRVAELIATLAESAEPPAPVYDGEPPATVFGSAAYQMPTYEPPASEVPTYEAPAYEAPAYGVAPFEVPEIDVAALEAAAAFEVPQFEVPRVEMPEWTPLPEADVAEAELPEMVLSQIVLDELAPEPEAPQSHEPITEIEPLPEGSVLAAAAALAELEDLLQDVPPAPAGSVVDAADEMVTNAREILASTAPVEGSDGASVPSEAALTLAAAALLGGARPAPEVETPKVRPERPEDIPEDLADRLSRLEVLYNCGIMSEDDYLNAEAEIFELIRAASASA